ncbi:hypothetical protein LA080_006854 [Diaporthe eres]|nr:hypothetical protein LA080_006854 [Diaporthe eres]
MPCQLLAWLRQGRSRASRQLPAAHATHHSRVDPEDVEILRARHLPKRPLNAPIPTDSPIEAAYLSGATAISGLMRTAQDETHPAMIIARTAQAISIAASSSRSYAALLAAVNAMERFAIAGYELDCGTGVPDDESGWNEWINSIDIAARQSLAQAPPSNSFIPHYELQSAGLVRPEMTLAERALLESFVMNIHIYRPPQ